MTRTPSADVDTTDETRSPEPAAAGETQLLLRAMRHWYEQAGIRVDPRRMLDVELQAGRNYWPPNLAPHVTHPLVERLGTGVRQELLVRQLYQYLQFTANYELRVINRATEMIANNRSGLPLSTEARLDAYKIYTDEGYHALYSTDMIRQVERTTGIAFREYDFDRFVRYLDDLEGQAPDLRAVVQMLVVVVFETLITGTLTQIPKDGNVVEAVRDIVTDHAEDEGRHHAFFSCFFPILWGGLSPGQRTQVGRLVPQMIVRPLEPPAAVIRASLEGAGLGRDEVVQVLAESYPRDAVMAGVRRTAKSTLRLFGNHGLYDDPEVRHAFDAAGLLVAERAPHVAAGRSAGGDGESS